MADPGGDGSNQHLPRTWFAMTDVFDGQWLVDLAQYGSLHVSPLSVNPAWAIPL